MISLRLCIFGKNTTEVILCPSQCIISRHVISLIIGGDNLFCYFFGDNNLDYLVKSMSAGFLH